MKWTTANIKNPNYNENHEIYVGTHTGSFKKIVVSDGENQFFQKNLQDISKLNKDSRITALSFGNEEKSEVLIGRSNKFVQVYSLESEVPKTNIEMMDTPVVGLCRFNTHIIAGFGNGKIQKLKINEDLVMTAGDNMSHMRQCEVNRELIATGGKNRQNNLKIFNVDAEKQVFTSKNLPNDFLQLEVPVWDSDVGFIDSNIVATCSRYGYVRVYDIRAQRRPIQKYANENQMSFSTLTAKDHYIYTGTTMGELKAFDTRQLKNFVHTYKGFTGSISDLYLDESGKYLASACLDRYVRVHHTDSCVLMYQCYVKSQAMKILIKQESKAEKPEEDDCVLVGVEEDGSENKEEEEEVQKQEQKDDEYDEMFNNMPTICEKDSNSDNDDVKDNSSVKRKSQETISKNKKKRKHNKNA